ncbi:MAG TPA: FtsX-like permease family protein, partial [Polyangiales bacterium]|nr:FtsX-like permease family protein [Polyangiales bacterium]
AFGGSIAVMYYQAMQVAFARGQNIDRIDLAVDKREHAAAVAKQLQARLGSAFHVERPERKSDRVAKLLVGMRMGLTMGSMIALLVGVFLIYNTMSISVVQRKREIGILRALGTTRGEVSRLLTLEGFLLGLVGAALGVVLGVLLSRGMLATVGRSVTELYLQVSVGTVHLDRSLIVFSFGLGVAGATLASAFPARAAARQRPVETLGTASLVTVAAPSRALTKTDIAAILAFLAAYPLLRLPPLGPPLLGPLAASTLVLLGGALAMGRLLQLLHAALHPFVGSLFGLEARLATDNLPRDLGRSAATSGALMVGVAMAMSFAVFVGSLTTSMMEWIDRSIPADLFITAAAKFAGTKSMPMSPALRADLAAVPGVEWVERVRVVDTDFHETPIKLLATDSAIFERRSKITMLEGSQAEALRALRAGAVIVSENFSRRFDVHRGDQIALSVKDGTRAFEVAGVDVDYTSDQGTVLMERDVYVKLWADDQVDTYKLYLKPNANIEAVRSQIVKQHGERYDLFVLTNREFKTEIVRLLDQVFAIMHALEAVALVIAVLGVVNALFANVIDRVREIGVLRALGMQRRQVRKMIVVEGVLIAIAGVIGGTLVGSVTGYILLHHINLAQSGWFFPYRPAWLAAAETAVLVVIVAGIAASYPARRAAALVVADALEYE